MCVGGLSCCYTTKFYQWYIVYVCWRPLLLLYYKVLSVIRWQCMYALVTGGISHRYASRLYWQGTIQGGPSQLSDCSCLQQCADCWPLAVSPGGQWVMMRRMNQLCTLSRAEPSCKGCTGVCSLVGVWAQSTTGDYTSRPENKNMIMIGSLLCLISWEPRALTKADGHIHQFQNTYTHTHTHTHHKIKAF